MLPGRVFNNRRRLSLYLVPVMMGMFGVLFAGSLDTPVLRGIALLLSVAGPLVAAGYILANIRGQKLERLLLVAGIVLLMIGALVTASGLAGTLGRSDWYVRDSIRVLSNWIGLGSLLLGMLAILSSVVRTGEAIEEIGARFRHLADHMGEGFILAGADGAVVLVNQRFLELTGLEERAAAGMTLREIAERLNSDVLVPQLSDRLKGHAGEYRCTWVINGEEKHFLVSGRPLFDRRGRLAGTLATVRDVTEQEVLSRRLERYTHGLQKLVEDRTQKLRQSEERFRDLLLHMSEGFLTVDGSFHVRFVNDRICEVLQISPPSLLGREVFEFVDAPGRGRLLDLFEIARTHADRPTPQELIFLREDGTRIPVMAAVAGIRESEIPEEAGAEAEARFSMVITDISELKRMQQQLEVRANELQAANEELQMLDRAKDGFLSNVSHELRTPLATIRGYAEMLRGGDLGALQPGQVNAIGIMERNVQRLGMLIDEMIEFSRMQIRGIHLLTNLFSLRSVIQECVSSAGPQASARGITFDTEIEEGAQIAWGDRKRIAQVLTILLSNAVKFSHPAGRVDVVVRRRPERGLAVSVVDHGIGIPASFHERVFDKFFQVDSSHTRRYEGTGIGLSIAKNIAEAHGGTIELSSQQGAGSTFTLVLPHAHFDPHYVPQDEERLDGVSSVVAEEEEDCRRALTTLLEGAGCTVVGVRSGHECIRTVRESQPQVAILGEMMSDLSGLATLRKLQEMPESEGLPAVLLQSHPLRGGVEAGPVPAHVLVKPFAAAELLRQVAEACLRETFAAEEAPAPAGGRRGGGGVLAVDSDPDFLAWLETGLERRRIECHCVQDINEALGVADHCQPDVILIDIDSGNGTAAQVIERLRTSGATREVPIYVITGMPIEYYEGLGVVGTLRKPFTIGDVVDIVLGDSRTP